MRMIGILFAIGRRARGGLGPVRGAYPLSCVSCRKTRSTRREGGGSYYKRQGERPENERERESLKLCKSERRGYILYTIAAACVSGFGTRLVFAWGTRDDRASIDVVHLLYVFLGRGGGRAGGTKRARGQRGGLRVWWWHRGFVSGITQDEETTNAGCPAFPMRTRFFPLAGDWRISEKENSKERRWNDELRPCFLF